jgi:hypothetical protein
MTEEGIAELVLDIEGTDPSKWVQISDKMSILRKLACLQRDIPESMVESLIEVATTTERVSNKVQMLARKTLSGFFSFEDGRQEYIRAILDRYNIFNIVRSESTDKYWIRALANYAAVSKERQMAILSLGIDVGIQMAITRGLGWIDSAWRTIGRFVRAICAFELDDEQVETIGQLVQSLVKIHTKVDVTTEFAFFDAYVAYSRCHPRAPLDLGSFEIVERLVGSCMPDRDDYPRRMYSFLHEVCSGTEEFCLMALSQGILNLLFDGIARGAVEKWNRVVVNCAEMIWCLVTVDADSVVRSGCLEGVDGLVDEVCFEAKMFLLAATLLAVAGATEGLLEILMGSMGIMNAVFQGFWVDVEQLEELQVTAMLKILTKARMAVGEHATIEMFGEENEWAEKLRIMKEEGEAANDEVLRSWFARVMNQET